MDNSTIKKIGLASLLSIGAANTYAHDGGHEHNVHVNQSVKFIENKGQWEGFIKYKANIPSGTFFLTDQGFTYNFADEKKLAKAHDILCGGNEIKPGDSLIDQHAYRVTYLGANTRVTYSSNGKSKNYNNYFIGNDKTKWASYVYEYNEVAQKNVYDGIDLVVKGNESSIKYEFLVAPNVDPAKIKLKYEGVTPIINKEGQLVIKTSVNTIIEDAPYTYQIIDGKKVTVPSKYKLLDNVLMFDFPSGFNPTLPLVVDPNLVFATFSGATTGTNYAHSTTYDAEGNTYAAGIISSSTSTWPTTVGAYQTNILTTNSVGINKYNRDGSGIVYSTFFGTTNTSNPTPSTLRVNDKGELFMAGSCPSATLPTTAGAYQTTLRGGSDIYVVRFNDAGSALLACTYIGGSGIESSRVNTTAAYSGNMDQGNPINPTDIAFDSNNNIWITSNSGSTDFPVTANAYRSTLSGSHDAVLIKMPQDLSAITYATYIGGTGWDGGIGIEYNANNNTVGIAGYTKSTDFPTTTGVMHTTAPGGSIDGFALLIDNNNYNVLASSYIGTSSEDIATRIAFDCNDNFYIAGRTLGNYPVTATGTHVVPTGYVFVDKLTPLLTASQASIRTGAAHSSIVPSAMMVDICGNILVATITNNAHQANMPLTPDAFETAARGFYFAAYEPNFTGMIFGSYFGASTQSDHFHPGVARIDPQGIIYHSVCYSGSLPIGQTNWPTPAHAWSKDKLNGATNDVVTFKFDFEAVSVKVEGESPEGGYNDATHAIRGCKSAFLHYRMNPPEETAVIKLQILGDAINGTDYATIVDSLVFDPGDTLKTIEIKALRVPQATGTKRVIINTFAPCSCDGASDRIISSDTVLIIDSVYVNMPRSFGYTCPADSISIGVTIDSTLNYYWEPRNLINEYVGQGIKVAPTVTTQYTVTASQPGAPSTCPSRSATYTAYVEPNPIITFPNDVVTVCLVDSYALNVYVQPGGQDYDYTWSPNTYISNPKDPNTKFAAPVGNYKMYVNVKTPRAGCSSDDTLDITVVPPFMFTQVKPEDTLIKLGESVQLDVMGSAVMWVWSPVDYIADPMVKNPIVTPDSSMRYRVVGWDKYGCTDTAYANVRVQHQSNLFIPNAFSPNGDGLNDIFKIENITYERLQIFRIVNRWGEVVFETQDPKKGWDGNIDGKPAPTDVYYYHITLTPPIEKDDIKITGDVTLTR